MKEENKNKKVEKKIILTKELRSLKIKVQTL